MADRYAVAAASASVAALAEAAGFDLIRRSASDTLAEILMRYLEEIGAGAHAYAEEAGRADPNAVDLLLSLNDLGVSLSDLTEYVDAGGAEVPFPTPICDFPVSRRPRPPRSFDEAGETPPPHVPSFLPAFPDPHTYRCTPSFPGAEAGGDAAEAAEAKAARATAEGDERRGAESALVRLAARAAPENPLLAPALERGGGAQGTGRGGEGPDGQGGGAYGRGPPSGEGAPIEAAGASMGDASAASDAALASSHRQPPSALTTALFGRCVGNPFLELADPLAHPGAASSSAAPSRSAAVSSTGSLAFATPQWTARGGSSAAAARWGAVVLPPGEGDAAQAPEAAGSLPPGGASRPIDPAAPPEATRLDASAAARARAAEAMRAAAPLFAPGDAWGPAPEAPAGPVDEADAFDAPDGAGAPVARGGRALKRSQRASDGAAAAHDPLRARAEAVLAAAEKGTDLLGPAPGAFDGDDVERV